MNTELKQSYPERTADTFRPIRTLVGSMAGVGAGHMLTVTGVETFIHEYVGHILLGHELTHDQNPYGERSIWQVDGFDNIRELGHSKDISEFFRNLGRVLIDYDAHQDGRSGWARPARNDQPNALGEKMGDEGRSAWLSITGSLPALVINTALVSGGISTAKNRPFLGGALMGSGLVGHAMSSAYPCSAAAMSTEELIYKSKTSGHDFANFAVKMGSVTGCDPKLVAVTTAVAYTAFLPLVALGVYLYRAKQELHLVPDGLAFHRWASDPENHEEVAQLVQQGHEKCKNMRLCDLHEYLLTHAPKKKLKAAKREILKEWKRRSERPVSRLEKVLKYSTGLFVMTNLVSRLFDLLSQTIVPALGGAATALRVVSPISGVVSLIVVGRETYRVCKNHRTPRSVKMLSVAKLVMHVALTASLIAGMVFPPAALIGMGVTVITVLGTLAIDYAMFRIMKRKFLAESEAPTAQRLLGPASRRPSVASVNFS